MKVVKSKEKQTLAVESTTWGFHKNLRFIHRHKRYMYSLTYSKGFFQPVRWSYGNKPFGNEKEEVEELRRVSNSSKSSDKGL